MGKLSDIAKGLITKIKALSRTRKIAALVGLVALILVAGYFIVQANTVKYSVLFSNLSTDDQKQIQQALTTAKVTAQYKGNTVLVPSNKVDELRFQLASTITGGSKGWELFDSSNSFSTTDTDQKVKFIQAQSGELEKTLKNFFPQVENAKVNLVIPDDSVFVKDATEASASVALKLKSGEKLSDDNVKAIVSLVSASVKNLPKKNIQVVDNSMNLLTNPGMFDDNNGTSSDLTNATDKQQAAKKAYEKSLEDKVTQLLGLPYKNKVSVKINADMNFDAVSEEKTTVAPTGTVVSSHETTSNTMPTNTTTTSTNAANPTGTTSTVSTTTTGSQASTNNTQATATANTNSPVDNNMVNSSTTAQSASNNGVTTSKDVTTNYDYSKTQDKTIKAPGHVNRLTASVIIDNKNLDAATKTSITNIVAGAIGYNAQNGDVINVEGMSFDTSAQKAAQQAINDMNKIDQKKQQMDLIKYILVGLGAIFLLSVVLISLKKNKKDEFGDELDFEDEPQGIDVVIGDDDEVNEVKEQVQFKPIDFDEEANDEKAHIEKEIKRYASEKPEQVVDIIKSWLAEDER